jgi:phosphopantothenoylcysteine decarboxylase / phosphopantothenate---cysteine ligase
MKQAAAKHVTIGIGGGISAYRILELIRLLKKNGVSITAAPTKAALHFITELSLETLSQNACLSLPLQTSKGKIAHIEEAYQSNLMVVAPATCDLIAKMAHGFADEILLQTLLSFQGPVLIAPAMETHMWQHPATQANVEILRNRGVQIIGPESGDLASGRQGPGRMASVNDIFEHILCNLTEQNFAGIEALVTAGPTVENLDPVRFLSNHSSGKMGLALAKALAQRGALVHLVHGSLSVAIPRLANLRTYPVNSADNMLSQVLELVCHVQLAICCAAVADYRPAQVAREKIKKSEDTINLSLVKNPDILARLGQASPKPFLVGFAAETIDLKKNAVAKCLQKNCDLICANLISKDNPAFGTDNNEIQIFDQNNLVLRIKNQRKDYIAHIILDTINNYIQASTI